ncbi:MAG: glycerophosphodiester phosphodiesterase [Calditrichia bacterium]
MLGNRSLPLILAHRGLHDIHPENTIPALDQIGDYNIDGFEIDIQFTSDNEIIVFHDKNLKRMSKKKGQIKSISRDALKSVSLFHPRQKKTAYYHGSIPMLSELINRFAEKYVINIEIKTDKPMNTRQVEVLLSFFSDRNSYDNIIFSSFEIKNLKLIKEANPYLKTGFLIEVWDNQERVLEQHNYLDYLHPHKKLLKDSCFVEYVRERNLSLFVWTVNRWSSEIVNNLDWIRGIITDNPVGLLSDNRFIKNSVN